MKKVLVIDDDQSICQSLSDTLTSEQVQITSATNATDGLAKLKEISPDVVLMDVVLPEISGLELFQQIRKFDRRLPVVFLSSGTDSTAAIQAMQLGAFDYMSKPLDLTALVDLVEQAIDARRMMKTPVALSVGDGVAADADTFVGQSLPMVEVFKLIGRVAAENVPVLIRGESGTGKELVARAIYQNSNRSDENFVAINCAALPDTLLESELFGHEKGAFTGADKQRIGKFEACNGGTIFLDEIGDMSQLVQSKVLRLLQQQEFERVGGNETIRTDVRIVTATNLDLDQMVIDGEFREDLFYRLNGLTISLPPVRERDEDIVCLLEHYLRIWTTRMGRTDVEGISPEALEILTQYPWPGNVRELQNVVRQTLLATVGPVIVPAFLPEELSGLQSGTSANNSTGTDSDLANFISTRLQGESQDLYAEALEQMERYLMTRVLQHTEGNQTKASEILGITRGKVRDRVKQFGIALDKTISLGDQ